MHKKAQSPPRKQKLDSDDNFQHYKIKTAPHTPRFSFGMGFGGELFKSTKRNLPSHLQNEKKSPGPGQYESVSSMQTKYRATNSMQDSTWAKVHGGSFIDIPKNNPGPGQYSPGRLVDEIHRPKSLERGFAFSQDDRDSMSRELNKNRNPGPGEYERRGMLSHTFNRVHKGELEPRYKDDKSVPTIDNGVPGPGAYHPASRDGVPSFKICDASPKTE